MELYLKEALYYAKLNKINDPEKQIRETLWGKSNLLSQKRNFTNLIKGHTKATSEVIRVFCDVCKVEPNFIYYGPEK